MAKIANKQKQGHERRLLRTFQQLAAIAPLLVVSHEAAAYIGPGLGAGTLGVILGLLASVFLALFAFFWYPIKRALFGDRESSKTEESQPSEQDAPAAPEAATRPEEK